MKEAEIPIKKLREKIEKSKKDLANLELALKAFQAVCEHEWRYDGHTHNYDHYLCVICGTEEER